jgi:hypothetical protein
MPKPALPLPLPALLLLALLPSVARALPPVLEPLAAPRHVAQWERFEASVRITPEPANPFDPAEADLRAVFEAPDGRRFEAIGFWYQGFARALVGGREQLEPVGEPHWRVRFTPDRPGEWRWHWTLRTPDGTAASETARFAVRATQHPGFLRPSPRDPRYLAFDDGTPFFAVGENTGWYDARGSFAYDAWFGRLAAEGANYGRLWMPSWAFGIEWNDTGLGQYRERLGRAWQLDTVLEAAEREGIYVMLSLLNHGAFSTFANTEWEANPYNAENGGPLDFTVQVFTNPEARALLERRFRYVVARWGWSTHLLAWELWNEVDLVSVVYVAPDVTRWHRELAELLRALDPHDHLITSSHAQRTLHRGVWNQGGLDFTQIHFYADSFPPQRNLARNVIDWTGERFAATGRPVLFGELGVDSRGPAETRAADPEGIGIHDGLWAGVVSGGIGTAMSWWWDNLIDLEPERYYPMFGALARFVRGVAFDREGFVPADAAVTGAARPVVAFGLAGERNVLVWLKDDAFQWYAPQSALVAGATLELRGVEGAWCARFYDTWAGAWGPQLPVRAHGGRLVLAVPDFAGDAALRLSRGCGETQAPAAWR